MTEWVERPGGGRARGLRGLGLAWRDVLIRPHWFFSSQIAPGDQAPGLTFAAAIVLVEETSRIAFLEGAIPVFNNQPVASAVLWVLAAVVLLAPAAIHLTAAVQTVLLIGVAPEREGVSETVQVICYAMAPCLFAGIPSPWVRATVALWGVGLLVYGTVVVHEIDPVRAVVVVLAPAGVIFAYGFGGADALAFVGKRMLEAILAGEIPTDFRPSVY